MRAGHLTVEAFAEINPEVPQASNGGCQWSYNFGQYRFSPSLGPCMSVAIAQGNAMKGAVVFSGTAAWGGLEASHLA